MPASWLLPAFLAAAALLDSFVSRCTATLGGTQHYFMAEHEDMRNIAVMLRHLPLCLRDAYIFWLRWVA